MNITFIDKLRSRMRNVSFWIQALIIAASGLTPVLLSRPTGAAQLTSRKAAINKAYVSATDVEFAFSYTLANTTSTKAGIRYQFCTTPLGTCTATSMTLTGNVHDSQSGWPTNGTAFTVQSGDLGDCLETTNSTKEICYDRDETVATGITGGAVTHTISGVNSHSSTQTVYIRISVYSDDDYGSGDLLDEGVVAVAFVNQLTITGRVQENLVFCVGTDDAGSTNDCADISGTSVDIGVIDSATVNISPVASGGGGNNKNGLAMLRTNAQSGATISYYAEQNTSSGKFKVAGATCSGVSTTDQCFNSTGTTQNPIVAGTEEFGLTVSSVDVTNGTTTNITRNTDYDGDGTAGGGWAWDDTGTVDQIASSATVVDDEMLVLRFAATAQTTTPTGSYTVTSTYIATPTF